LSEDLNNPRSFLNIEFMKRFLMYSKVHPYKNLFNSEEFVIKIDHAIKAIGISYFNVDSSKEIFNYVNNTDKGELYEYTPINFKYISPPSSYFISTPDPSNN
jgi:hypothetical protein